MGDSIYGLFWNGKNDLKSIVDAMEIELKIAVSLVSFKVKQMAYYESETFN